MNNFPLFCLLTTLFFSASTFSQTTQPAPASDNQVWSDVQINFPVIKAKDKKGKEFDRLSIFLTGTLRFGRDVSASIDRRIGFGFEYKLNNYVSFAPSYFYRDAEPLKDRKEYESRVRFAVNLEKKFSRVSIRNRNLVEYRIRNARDNSTRYRNRFQLFIPVTRDKKEIFAPFVGNEIFYDFSTKNVSRDEFSAGISKRFSPLYSADFYYLLQKNRGNVLRTLNVFGMSLKIKID